MCFRLEAEEAADPSLSRALLWSMRATAIGFDRGTSVDDLVERRFAQLGVSGIAAHLHVLMWILRHYAARRLAVGCVCAPRPSNDERHLLDILAVAQHGGSVELLVQRHGLVSVKAAASLADTARGMMACFSAVDWFLSARPARTIH